MAPRQSPNKATPCLDGGVLTDGEASISLESPEWLMWLATAKRFALRTSTNGNVLFRKEARERGGSYWSAYRRVGGQTYQVYVGKDAELNQATLHATAERLAGRIAAQGSPKQVGKRRIDPPQIRAVRFDKAMIWFDLIDGRVLGAPLAWFPSLLEAGAAQRADWRLIGSATGVAWDALDEHLSIRVLMNLLS
jgi:hypothetical protein